MKAQITALASCEAGRASWVVLSELCVLSVGRRPRDRVPRCVRSISDGCINELMFTCGGVESGVCRVQVIHRISTGFSVKQHNKLHKPIFNELNWKKIAAISRVLTLGGKQVYYERDQSVFSLEFKVKHSHRVSLTWRVTEGVRGGIRQRVEGRGSAGTTRHWTLTHRRLVRQEIQSLKFYMYTYKLYNLIAIWCNFMKYVQDFSCLFTYLVYLFIQYL